MAELLIRPSHNDHLVVADLLAPGGSAVLLRGVPRPISRLVLDAPLAAREKQFVEAAESTGTPVLVDPLTPLTQTVVDPSNSWAALPFGSSEPVSSDLLSNPFVLHPLVEQVVAFQVACGATAIIPPYFYAEAPGDPAFEASLLAIGRTARYMRDNAIKLPIMPILCAKRRSFARVSNFAAGLDRFAQAALEVGPHALALCLSPMGTGDEGHAQVLSLFQAAQRLKVTGARVYAWRQGFYGPGLVAADLDGYETGIGLLERTNIAQMRRNRAPRDDARNGSAQPGVYLEALGRSVPVDTAQVLLGDRVLAGRLVCSDRRCCPAGASSMIGEKRKHAVRARARALSDLALMPHSAWRLHQVAKASLEGALAVAKANEVLAAAGVDTRLTSRGLEALAGVADLLSQRARPAA